MRTITTLLAALLLGMTATNHAEAKLSRAEQAMIGDVEQQQERWIGLLERMVNQNSGSRNLDGVRKVGAMLTPEFEELGFEVTWIPQDEVNRGGHLVALHKGRKDRKRLLLIGHMDTVFEPDSPFQTFVRRGSIAEGPGVEDDKGGVIVILSALHAMKSAGTLNGANIVVVLTGDEEDAGDPTSISRAELVKWAEWADAALDFEGLSIEDGKDMGVVARRSSYSWQLETSGKEGHSSGIFSKSAGEGAVFEMVRILARFRAELPEPNLTFNIGLLSGGSIATLDADGLRASAAGKTNIIPSTAIARGDIRTLSDAQTERVVAKMTAIVADHAPGTDAHIVFERGYPPMAPTDGNRALLAELNGVNADMGLERMEELDPLKRGAGDISFVAREVDGLVGLGAYGEGSHAPGETVDLDSIVKQAKRAAILMSRLARQPR